MGILSCLNFVPLLRFHIDKLSSAAHVTRIEPSSAKELHHTLLSCSRVLTRVILCHGISDRALSQWAGLIKVRVHHAPPNLACSHTVRRRLAPTRARLQSLRHVDIIVNTDEINSKEGRIKRCPLLEEY